MKRAPAMRTLNELLACKAIRKQYDRANRAGYAVHFRQFCEDAQTPGLLGAIGGKCCYEDHVIIVSIFRRPLAQIAAILRHECDHAEGKEVADDDPAHGLRCGNRRRFHVERVTRSDAGGPLFAPVDQFGREHGMTPSHDEAAMRRACDQINARGQP